MKSLRLLVLIMILGTLQGCNDPEIITFEEQLAADIEAIDSYLEENNIDAVEDPSGIRYVIETAGTGVIPSIQSFITANYEGRFFDGSVFQKGSLPSSPPTRVSGLIAGWQIILTKIKEGTVVTVYIPSGLAYGTRGSGSIPPNTNLIFDLELTEVF